MPNVKCKICGKEFYSKPNWIKRGWGKYCSRDCQFESQKKGKFINCYICNKEAWKRPKDILNSKSGNFFCSKKCQTIWRNKFFSGDKHPNWIDGSHQGYRKFMLENSINPSCRLCNNNDERILVVHHLDRARTNNQINNLVWVCRNCHYLIHNFDLDIN